MKPIAVLAMAATVGAGHAALNSRLLRRPVPGATSARSVALLVPARDEHADIAACVRTLLAQRGLTGCTQLLVLDDGSRDATADIARRAGADVRTGDQLPAGWLGKPYACQQLADATTADVLVFVDADVRLVPAAVAAAVDLLDRFDLDFVSPYPRQVAFSPMERLVQPLLTWTWLTLLPLRAAERSPRRSLAVAGGQFLVVRRTAYRRAGGHAAVRAHVLDDVALARALRVAGARGGIVDGSTLASCRMYRGAQAVRAGYAKSLGVAVGGSGWASLATAGGLFAVWTLPLLAAVLRGSRAGWVGYAAAVAGRAIAGRSAGSRVWPDALAHPLSITIAAAITVDSVLRRHDVSWRGRVVVA